MTQEPNRHVQDMYDYHAEGHSLAEVGAQFGVTRQLVSKTFQRYGYKVQERSTRPKRFPEHGAAIIAFIRDYKAQYQDTPSYKAIAEAVTGDERNNGNVYRMVERLIELGYLYRAGASGDVLMLIQPQPKIPEAAK